MTCVYRPKYRKDGEGNWTEQVNVLSYACDWMFRKVIDGKMNVAECERNMSKIRMWLSVNGTRTNKKRLPFVGKSSKCIATKILCKYVNSIFIGNVFWKKLMFYKCALHELSERGTVYESF